MCFKQFCNWRFKGINSCHSVNFIFLKYVSYICYSSYFSPFDPIPSLRRGYYFPPQLQCMLGKAWQWGHVSGVPLFTVLWNSQQSAPAKTEPVAALSPSLMSVTQASCSRGSMMSQNTTTKQGIGIQTHDSVENI